MTTPDLRQRLLTLSTDKGYPGMMSASKKEIAETLADRDWWQSIGDILNLRLHGWTYRDSALFFDRVTSQEVAISNAVANRLVALSSDDSDLRTRLLTHAADLDCRVVRRGQGKVPQVPDDNEAIMEALADVCRALAQEEKAK